MGFLDRLFGAADTQRSAAPVPRNVAPTANDQTTWRDSDGRYAPPPAAGSSGHAIRSEDDRAVERYRYLLRTAPPETIEQVHTEAFAKLTPAQRQEVLADITRTLPPSERPTTDDPQTMARAATRAEYSRPGYMERTFGGSGFASMLGGSLLGTVAGYVVASALVSSFMAPVESTDAMTDAGGTEYGFDGDLASDDLAGFGGFGSDLGAFDIF